MNKKGFTLVELLVVITILAILSTIGLTVFGGVQKSARDSKRRADLKSIANALEIYKARSSDGLYPKTTGTILSTASDPWIPGLTSDYMVSIPVDPINIAGIPTSGPWYGDFTYAYYSAAPYISNSEGTYFMLYAHLESPNSDDLRTRCRIPSIDNVSNGSGHESVNTSGATNFSNDTFWICNQQ